VATPLSVLDLTPIRSGGSPAEAIANTFELAQQTEGWGYTRYWLAEHHNTSGLASASPEILIGLVAAKTRTLRVGAGGIMLPNHSPLRIAESFRLLEALYPGRIDLGLGRAPGTDQLTAFALRRSMERMRADDFPDQVQELLAYAGKAAFPPELPFAPIVAMPTGVDLPPLWLLSSSGFGAEMAAQLGLPLAFAHHFSPAAALSSMRAYRRNFRPSQHLAAPHAILTVSVICSDTEERAEALARCVDLMWLRFHRGMRGPLPSVEEASAHRFTDEEQAQARVSRGMLTWGTIHTVEPRLRALVEQMGADELMISTHVPVQAERLRSYQLLAEAFGLKGPGSVPKDPQ
jgi:luciferase family oxidoreductase group 1